MSNGRALISELCVCVCVVVVVIMMVAVVVVKQVDVISIFNAAQYC